MSCWLMKADAVANSLVVDTNVLGCNSPRHSSAAIQPREDYAKFIHTALASASRWLVSGDQDLLVINAPLPVCILTPGQALQRDDFLA